MSGVNSTATLSVEIQTGPALTSLNELAAAYKLLKSELGGQVKATGASEAVEKEMVKLKGANKDLKAQIDALKQDVATFKALAHNASAAAVSTAVTLSGGLNGAVNKVRKDLDSMGGVFKTTTDKIISEKERLSKAGVDLNSLAKGITLKNSVDPESVKSLEKYISTLETARAVLNKTKSVIGGSGASETIKQKYGSTIIDEIKNLGTYRSALASLTEGQARREDVQSRWDARRLVRVASMKAEADAAEYLHKVQLKSAEMKGAADVRDFDKRQKTDGTAYLTDARAAIKAHRDEQKRDDASFLADSRAAIATHRANETRRDREFLADSNAAIKAHRDQQKKEDAAYIAEARERGKGAIEAAKKEREQLSTMSAAMAAEELAERKRSDASYVAQARSRGRAAQEEAKKERDQLAAMSAAMAAEQIAERKAEDARYLASARDAVKAHRASQKQEDAVFLADSRAAIAAHKASEKQIDRDFLTDSKAAIKAYRSQEASENKAFLSEARARYAAHLAEMKAMDARSAAERQMHLDIAAKAKARAERVANNNQLNSNFGYGYGGDALKAARNKLSTTEGVEKMLSAGASSRDIVGSYGSDAFLAVRNGATSAKELRREIDALKDSHKNTGAAAKQAADHHVQWNKVAHEAHSLARGLSGSLGTLWVTYGSLIPMLSGAALGGAFVQAAKGGAEFEHQLTFVKALSDETATSMAAVRDTALSLGQNSNYGPVELASGFRILAQAGLNASDSIIAINSAIDLAVVGEMTMEQASVTLVGVMNAFGLTSSSISHIGDVFAKAAALSQTSVDAMTEAMKTASVVGEQYGASMEDTATALTLLAKVNIQGTSAGTALRNMLKELYAPVPQAAKALKQLGVDTKDAEGNLKSFPDIIYSMRTQLEQFDKASQVNILQKIFGERGAKEAIAMLSKTRDTWDELQGKIAQSSGFMRQVASELEATTKSVATQALNVLKTDLVKAFEATEGPMKDMAVRMKMVFASSDFQSAATGAVTLMGKFASAVVSATGIVAHLLKIMPEGVSTFLAVSAAVAASSMAISAFYSATQSMVTGLVALRMAAAGASMGLAPLYIAVGALAAGYVLFSSKTPAAIEGIRALNSALDTQIERLRLINSELQRKLGLEGQGATSDVTAAQRELNKSKAQLATYQKLLDEDAADKRSIASKEIGDRSSTDPEVRQRRKDIVEARVNISELKRLVGQAELKVAIAKGYEIETQKNQSKVMTQELIRQKEEEERMKSGTKVWVDLAKDAKSGKGGKGKLPKDYETADEKADIALLKEQQKRELDVLESSHKHKLISEEAYQIQSAAIYASYSDELEQAYYDSGKRLGDIVASTSGDEQTRAKTSLKQLMIDHQKYLAEKEQRLLDSSNKELQIIKEAQDKTAAIIKQAKTDVAEIIDRDMSNRRKQGMSPERAAAYDSGRAAGKTLDKSINEKQSAIDAKIAAGASAESIEIRKLTDDVNNLRGAREELVKQAEDAAYKEAEYARSFLSGWTNAYQGALNESTNYAKTAESVFNKAYSSMTDALVNFANTGKFEWKSLASSIIQEMLRIQSQKLALAAMGALTGGSGGGGGLLGSFAGAALNYFVPGAGTALTYGTNIGSQQTSMLAAQDAGFANGGAFSSSQMIHAFANGGAFTNSIFDSPTAFRFANGGKFSPGIMGEAGPEAVMPLGRDSQGKLGVHLASAPAAQQAQSAAPAQNNIRIVNAFDVSTISDHMGSVEGEKIIMNAVKKNQTAIRRLASA